MSYESDTEMLEGNEYNESDPLEGSIPIDISHPYDEESTESVASSVVNEIEIHSEKTPISEPKYIFI